MLKSKLKYILIGLGVLIFLIILEYSPQKTHDWSPDYLSNAKSPQGTYLLHQHSKEVFENLEISNYSVYESLRAGAFPVHEGSVYFFVNDRFLIDYASLDELLDYVVTGGTAFISAYSFDEALLESLNVEHTIGNFMPLMLVAENNIDFFRDKKFTIDLPEPYDSMRYSYSAGLFNSYFDAYVETYSHVLAKDEEGHAVYIAVEHGAGKVYLHSQPRIFSNYFMRDYDYVQHVYHIIGYLPDKKMLWDDFHKSGRAVNQVEGELSFILSQPSLAIAYFLMIAVVLISVVFGMKRKQRPIPEYAPPVNTSLNFVKTIGSLFYEQKDHTLMGQKKLTFFRQYLYEHYGITPRMYNVDNKSLISKLTAVSGMDEKEIVILVQLILRLQDKVNWHKTDLVTLEEKLYLFTQKAKSHGKYHA